ncbi:MAG: electron transfer flavoprotein subunit beta/FixA family protein [Planctomycetota bacterium]|jgi:electron transfer flavoprotein beta subunit|nr:electron transfer flavoprotein subunit beta/FixA family protein [Planctomycetota bacterium]MDP6763012.1 electron transfer flavoprotein subunit beta/FixA family protein [Planctomycetota bacterium]MDP6990683.1 electron transfer flavoprotein subunit beta/FixA family protein [Planctomycetota bacterium]
MKIVACIKRVPTTDAQTRVAGGTALDSGSFQYMTSFYDEIAVEEAIRTREAHEGEVTVVTIGPSEASKELRECIAKGADRGVILTDADWSGRDCLSTARALAAQLEELAPQIVFMGKVATDRDNAAVGPMVATMLGWSCVTNVVDLELSDGAGKAKRETEHGIETHEFTLPAVITCDKGLNEPRYAGLKGIMAAKKKPLDELACAAPESQVTVCELTLPAPRAEGRIVGEGVEAVPALIDALRNEAQVL